MQIGTRASLRPDDAGGVVPPPHPAAQGDPGCAAGPLTTGELVTTVSADRHVLMQHLGVLREADLVIVEPRVGAGSITSMRSRSSGSTNVGPGERPRAARDSGGLT